MIMRKLKLILAAILMASVLGIGVFAQKGSDGNKRPPKEDNKVKVKDKEPKPPQNSNQGNNNKRRP